MFWIKKEKENATVTDFYTEIIGDALKSIGEKVISAYEWDEITPEKRDTVIVITSPNAIKAYARGLKYVYWSQGVWPEESYMRHKSIIRFKACGAIEKVALKHASFVFFVSESMKKFYEQKYHLDFTGRYYIMPCSNEVIHQDSFDTPQKYVDNIFCYAGGTSVWQCFEEMLALYKMIETQRKDARLLLLVKEKEYAEKLVSKYGIKNCEIDFVPVERLQERLRNVKFGFVIRKEDHVNYVATPTKVLTYLANGIIPIYSSSLGGIDPILSRTDYKVKYENDENITEILSLMDRQIDTSRIKSDYMKIYSDCYCRDEHIKKIAKIFEGRK